MGGLKDVETYEETSYFGHRSSFTAIGIFHQKLMTIKVDDAQPFYLPLLHYAWYIHIFILQKGFKFV